MNLDRVNQLRKPFRVGSNAKPTTILKRVWEFWYGSCVPRTITSRPAKLWVTKLKKKKTNKPKLQLNLDFTDTNNNCKTKKQKFVMKINGSSGSVQLHRILWGIHILNILSSLESLMVLSLHSNHFMWDCCNKTCW